MVVSVLAFAWWQLVMPAGFASVRGLNRLGVTSWRASLGLGAEPAVVDLAIYRALFRTFIVVAWVAYAGLLWLVAQGARFGGRWTWPLAIPLFALLVVVMPAALSTDVFAYVGYARLGTVHGLNPHVHTQAALVRLGDPTAPYLRWPIPSPYGPLWTLFSMGVVKSWGWLGQGGLHARGGILVPVLIFKACAAAALCGAAAAARALVRRTDPDSGRANAVFVLVSLNPLLLIEGPGNGHNDLVMAALLLAGVAALGVGRGRLAAVAVGFAAAVKLLPLLVVPWLAALAARAALGRGRSRAAAVAAAALTVTLAVLPIVVAYAPFWEGRATLGGVIARWHGGAGRSFLEWRDLIRLAPLLLIYLWGTLAICLGQGDAAHRLCTVWSYVALTILCFAAGMWCSWYLAWLWPAVLVRFTRPHMVLAAFAVPFSLLLMLAYATAPG